MILLTCIQEALDHDGKSPVVKYDLGTALYKKGDYAKALGYLQQAALDKNVKIKPKAEYNLGNALYKSGIQKENTNVDEAIKNLKEALGHYGQSLIDAPDDSDQNLMKSLLKKEIECLKLKKQQQQQDQKQKQDQKQQQQDQQNKQGGQNPAKSAGAARSEEQKDQKKQQGPTQSQEQKEKSAQQQADEAQKEIDYKQAEDLLENYRENEEPKKLLSYMPKKIDDRPVLRDW